MSTAYLTTAYDRIADELAVVSPQTAINALIGTRYWPDIAPEDAALPRVTYQVISEIRNDWISGPGVGKRCRIQINCWARTRAGADQLGDAVEAQLSYNGRIIFRLSTYDQEAQIYSTQLDWSVPILSP